MWRNNSSAPVGTSTALAEARLVRRPRQRQDGARLVAAGLAFGGDPVAEPLDEAFSIQAVEQLARLCLCLLGGHAG